MSADDESFEALANKEEQGVISECFYLLRANKKWWLLPIILVLIAVGVLIVLGGTGAAPFIYTLF